MEARRTTTRRALRPQPLRRESVRFAVLSKDIFTAPPAELADVQSVLTVVGGKVAFDAAVTSGAAGR